MFKQFLRLKLVDYLFLVNLLFVTQNNKYKKQIYNNYFTLIVTFNS